MEVDQAKARLARARTRRNQAHNEERRLKAERDHQLPEHVLGKLDSVDLAARLRDEVGAWLIGQAGISGDPTPPPAAALLLYELEKDEEGFRKFLAARITEMAEDPSSTAFTARSRKQIEGDLAKVSEQAESLAAEVEAAKGAERVAVDAWSAANNGRRPR